MSALTLDSLVAREHEAWRSLCESRGGTFYGATMSADAVMILVNGIALMTSTYRLMGDEPKLALYQRTTITH